MTQQTARRKRWLAAGLAVPVGLGAFVAFLVLMTDAATRLADEVIANARTLRRGTEPELSFDYVPRWWPSGCKGDYTVTFQESLHHPSSGGALLVGCKGTPEFETFGYNSSTTSHLNAVRVPVELSISRASGSVLSVTLRRQGDAIEIVRLK